MHPKYKTPVFDTKSVRFNEQRLVSFLRSCYSSDECYAFEPTLDTVVSLALLVVQFISPDVMYNGLPWPDEDFTKVKHTKFVTMMKTTSNQYFFPMCLGYYRKRRSYLPYDFYQTNTVDNTRNTSRTSTCTVLLFGLITSSLRLFNKPLGGSKP